MFSYIQFIGQVFVFWIFWKLFDFVHLFYKKQKPECGSCAKHQQQIDKLLLENQRLAKFEKINFEQKLVEMLNTASIEDLKEIHGVGKTRASYINSKRPFKNMEEVLETLPDSITEEALNWASKKLKEFKDGHSDLQTSPRS